MKTIACLAVLGYANAHTDVTLNRQTGIDKLIEKVGAVNFSFDDVTMQDHQDVYYSGPVSVGTPPTTFQVVYDTGSYNLVLEKKGCTTCKGADFYDPAGSSTAKRVDQQEYDLGYGSADLTAQKYTDRACIGDKLCANNYLMWPFVKETGLDLDGIMGMGPESATLFNNLQAQGTIDQQVFGFALGKADQVSSVRIGGVDETRMADPKAAKSWSPLANQDYWTLTLEGVTMGGTNLYTQWTSQAIVDSGTTVLVMEGTDYSNFVKQLQSETTGLEQTQQGILIYEGACPTNASDIEIKLGGGFVGKVPSSQYMEMIQGTCVVRAMSGGFGSFYILGDVFMRNYYTIFDGANSRVGFTPIAHPEESQKTQEKDIFEKIHEVVDSVSDNIDDITGDISDSIDKIGDDTQKIIDDIRKKFGDGVRKLF
jgi:hypothetical protein